MKYYIARFDKEIPSIASMQILSSTDNYTVIKIQEEHIDNFPFDSVSWEEITEFEATIATKFYGETRPYRSAYSDVEGLEPDEDELAKGKRKTKVYFTWEIYNATVSLMKRILKKNIQDEFDKRNSREGEQQLLNIIDNLTTIREINYKREELLGIEMAKPQLKELFLWDDETNSRIGRHQFTLGF